jgi:hypothetical protein
VAAQYVTFPGSPSLASSAFALTSVKGGLVVFVPSAAAVFSPVAIAFGQTPTGPFVPFNIEGTTSKMVLVGSSAGGAVVTIGSPPTPYGIFTVLSGFNTAVETFTVSPVARS